MNSIGKKDGKQTSKRIGKKKRELIRVEKEGKIGFLLPHDPTPEEMQEFVDKINELMGISDDGKDNNNKKDAEKCWDST